MLVVRTPNLSQSRGQKHRLGFSIVEMMVAMAAGLVLIGSVITLVVAVLQSNAENLAVTRLTQELRAIALVSGKEIRRAGFIANARDTIPNVKYVDPDTSLGAPLVNLATAGCIQVGYQLLLADGTTAARAVTIARVVSGGIGSVRAGFATSIAAPVACNAVTRTISSAQVDITGLSFLPDDAADVQNIRIVLTGRLAEGPVSVRGVASRSYIENVYLPALIAGS